MVVFMAPLMASRTFSLLSSKPMSFSSLNFLKKHLLISVPFSCSTRYPLQYELIAFHPVRSPVSASQRPRAHRPYGPENLPEKETIGSPELGSQEKDSDRTRFEEWVDKKLSARKMEIPNMGKPSGLEKMDKSKRKYYKKRMKRMYGSDSDDERGKEKDGYVELQPEVVDLPTLHAREEELYFYDAFAYPWEKEKHYRMVYQLEKKYFPDQCLDKAFVEPGESVKVKEGKNLKKSREKKEKLDVGGRQNGEGGDIDKRLVFFEEENGERGRSSVKSNESVSEKKVQEFFKCLKQMPKVEEDPGEPYILTTKTELPSRWDGPFGTVVLVNKPKGWTSFTVCGKLRRLVKVQKVGHAGTLDPMATGLLIVCVGKATKQVERFQDMIKGYSGIFRLGEATSTWDADSPVIQREPWEHIKDMDIKKAAASFHGEIWQVPPMFSAIKVGGEKMYEKARRGESIELSPRRISIFQFDIERSLDDRQNLIFRVTCSKGTYIRSLCADFGKLLGSCAHLTALRRDSIGQFSADDAWDFQELEDQVTKSYL